MGNNSLLPPLNNLDRDSKWTTIYKKHFNTSKKQQHKNAHTIKKHTYKKAKKTQKSAE